MIYNPVVSDHIGQLALAPPAHPWFDDPDLRVILSIGRLTRQKNFARLIRAFVGVVREEPSARLVIRPVIYDRLTVTYSALATVATASA